MLLKPWRRKTKEVLDEGIDHQRLPSHIAIIMDGNGRWAQKRGLPRTMGHKAGVEALREIVKTCSKLNIRVLTVYAFSTENWKRPKDEIGFLMNLLTEYLRHELEELNQNNVVVRALGVIDLLPVEAQTELNKAFKRTEKNTGLILNLALNYGGRGELVDAVKKISEQVVKGKLNLSDINEDCLSNCLYTAGQPDPDLLIRTSGEMRLSNFLLWQLAYTEIVVTDKLWPDFTKQDLLDALKTYQKRDRRFGGLKADKG